MILVLTTDTIHESIPVMNKKSTSLKQEVYKPKDVQIGRKFGGGVLKEYVIREIPSKKVIHYSVAYINAAIYSGDNGRVLGYDNSHGYSHKHYFGKITPDKFTSYEDLYDKFEMEWQKIAIDFVNGDLT
jgi:hypothetical protein